MNKTMFALLVGAAGAALSVTAQADGLPVTYDGVIVAATPFVCEVNSTAVSYSFGTMTAGAALAAEAAPIPVAVSCNGGTGGETATIRFGVSTAATASADEPGETDPHTCQGGPGDRCGTLNVFIDRDSNPTEPPTAVSDALIYTYFQSGSATGDLSVGCDGNGNNLQNARCTITNNGTAGGTVDFTFQGKLQTSATDPKVPTRTGPVEARPNDVPTFWVDVY